VTRETIKADVRCSLVPESARWRAFSGTKEGHTMTDQVLSKRTGVYSAITQTIVSAIEDGADEFVMPWHLAGPGFGRPTNAVTGKPYQGVNVVALWAQGQRQRFESTVWATYRQWTALGAQVRKGSRGAVIVFYKRREAGADDDDERRAGLIARTSVVFNDAQVEGGKLSAPQTLDAVTRIAAVDEVVHGTGADIRHGGANACYEPASDCIRVPPTESFVGSPTSSPTEAYYSTLLHELIHWTGASHRLKRQFGACFGDHAYAFEELVAELGAAFLCADLQITNHPRPDHAAYISGWLSVLKSDARAVFTAARLAGEAAAYVQDPAS
jgi:antirestriction protein ArdC